MIKKQLSNKKPEILSNRVIRLADPPRRVPLPTICTALIGRFGKFGGLYFSAGMFFVWIIGANSHPIDEWRLAQSSASAPAVVERVLSTNSRVNDVVVYEYRFRFNPGDGLPVYGNCYTTGQKWQAGDRVAAYYLPGNPEVACLKGARQSQSLNWVFFLVMFFPLVGICILFSSAVSGWRTVKLLRCGKITVAMNISSTPTNNSRNNDTVLTFSYEFRDRLGKKYKGVSRAFPTDKIGDEVREPVLYLPANPKQSMLVDALPLKFSLEVDEKGQWHHPQGIFKPVLWFIFIWGLVLVNVGIVVLKILGIW